MKNNLKLLIDIVLSLDEEDHVKDDAAMDLAEFNDPEALDALIKGVELHYNDEDPWFLSTFGESIAEIWVRKDCFDLNIYISLPGCVRSGAYSILEVKRPDWVEKYSLLKYGFKND